MPADTWCPLVIVFHCVFFVQCSGEIIPGRDVSWDQVMEKAKPHDCVPVLSTDPLYILYTSGTTGDPKVNQRQDQLTTKTCSPGLDTLCKSQSEKQQKRYREHCRSIYMILIHEIIRVIELQIECCLLCSSHYFPCFLCFYIMYTGQPDFL